jgi:hypothetical protein
MSVLRHNKSKLFDENVEMVNLLKEECCLDAIDISGETPLFKACYRGNVKVARALIDRGCDISIKAGEFFPFDLLKPGMTLEGLIRLAAKVARLVVRIKYENSIEVENTDILEPQIIAKTKKVVEVNALSSLADRDAFNKLAVNTPIDFVINIRDISNKLRLLSLRRLDIIKESKALCTGPYLYHKDLKARVIHEIDRGLEAYNQGQYRTAHDTWELATQLQQLKDWVATVLLRDKPIDKDQSDRIYNVFRLYCVYQTQKIVTHAQNLQLKSRVEVVRQRFLTDNNVEYNVHLAEKKKKKRRNKKII